MKKPIRAEILIIRVLSILVLYSAGLIVFMPNFWIYNIAFIVGCLLAKLGYERYVKINNDFEIKNLNYVLYKKEEETKLEILRAKAKATISELEKEAIEIKERLLHLEG